MFDVLEDEKIQKDEGIAKIYLPNQWWNTSNSFHFFSQESLHTAKIISMNQNREEIFKKENINDFSRRLKKDLDKGDYIIQSDSYPKDYAHYQKMKLNIIKYSIYPFLLLALFFTFLILNEIATIPL